MWMVPLIGWAKAEQGLAEEGLALTRHGIEALRYAGAEVSFSYFLSLLAAMQWKAGRSGEALASLAEAEDVVLRTGERWFVAEIYRLKGELLLIHDERTNTDPNHREVEDCFVRAIKTAHEQSARALELRATMSLSRLFANQDRKNEAREMLAAIHGWFSEGFDTPDLKEAAALLDQLA